MIALSDSFRLTVRADAGDIRRITDYHTIENARKVDGSKNENPVVSRREYLCDASFTAVLEFLPGGRFGQDDVLKNILAPVYTPFLGRRSCPFTEPLLAGEVEAEDALSALNKASPGRGVIYAERPLEGALPQPMMMRDVLIEAGRRQYGTRPVYVRAAEA